MYMMDPVELYNSFDYRNFNTNMLLFVNENKIKSSTDYLITTSLKEKYTYIFRKNNDKWM